MNTNLGEAAPNKMPLAKVRLDKWLWAARFFKTRSLAKQAIDGGKIHCNGQRAKASREISVGDELRISRGESEQLVQVLALASQRGGAPAAQLLYQETQASLNARQTQAEQRRLTGARALAPAKKPDKQARRALSRLKQQADAE